MNKHPVTVIKVLCDAKRVKRIALTCKCTRKWTEVIPGELHDSDLTAQFECPACGQCYHLRNKVLIRVKEDTYNHDREQAPEPFANVRIEDDKRYYDS